MEHGMLAVKELRLQRKHTRRDILGAQGIVKTGADPRDHTLGPP